MDLVGTCPKTFWEAWLEEGDCAGEPESGTVYAWFTKHRLGDSIRPGDRLYIVAHGKLRGYAMVEWIDEYGDGLGIVRRGGAVAVTIDQPIPGFQGLRKPWWKREDERPFPNWRKP